MVNYYFTDELYHHGVKGMKWGRRKRKEVRLKAKNYQKKLNASDKKLNSLLNIGWKLSESKNVAYKKAEKYKRKGNIKKQKEYLTKSNIMNKKLKDVVKQSKIEAKQIEHLINKISNDKDLVYTTSLLRENSSANSNYMKINRNLNKKYGRTPIYYEKSGFKSVNSNKWIVKSATNKNKNKNKFNDPYRKSNPRVRTRTHYYYY